MLNKRSGDAPYPKTLVSTLQAFSGLRESAL